MQILIFILGTILFSFLSCVYSRVLLQQDYLRGRSYCDYCFHQLDWISLIPIIGYLHNYGKCKFCNQQIKIIYPILEFIGGMMFLVSYHYKGISGILLVIIITSLIIQSLLDLKSGEISIGILVIQLIATMSSLFINDFFNINHLFGFLTVSGLMILINLFKESFGGGDIMIVSVTGLYLGSINNLIMISLAIIIASIYGLFLIILNKRQKYLKFIPFITVSTILVITRLSNIFIPFYLQIPL